jgi:hypothetical protein
MVGNSCWKQSVFNSVFFVSSLNFFILSLKTILFEPRSPGSFVGVISSESDLRSVFLQFAEALAFFLTDGSEDDKISDLESGEYRCEVRICLSKKREAALSSSLPPKIRERLYFLIE